jgi:hypothetical protein
MAGVGGEGSEAILTTSSNHSGVGMIQEAHGSMTTWPWRLFPEEHAITGAQAEGFAISLGRVSRPLLLTVAVASPGLLAPVPRAARETIFSANP